MIGSDDEGWFWYGWQKELEETEGGKNEAKPNESSTYKRVKVTEENENIPCARCGIPLGEQGDTALVKTTRFGFYEMEYFCEICEAMIERSKNSFP